MALRNGSKAGLTHQKIAMQFYKSLKKKTLFGLCHPAIGKQSWRFHIVKWRELFSDHKVYY